MDCLLLGSFRDRARDERLSSGMFSGSQAASSLLFPRRTSKPTIIRPHREQSNSVGQPPLAVWFFARRDQAGQPGVAVPPKLSFCVTLKPEKRKRGPVHFGVSLQNSSQPRPHSSVRPEI